MVIANQSMVANITGVALPNGDVLGPFSKNDEIKTQRGPQRDNDPKPNPVTRIPTTLVLCHVERSRDISYYFSFSISVRNI